MQCRSSRSIVRDPGVSKDTVRKAVRNGATEHLHSGRRVQPRPKLGSYVVEFEGLLEANSGWNRRDRLTIKAIDCEAGHDAVRRHAGQWPTMRAAGCPAPLFRWN